MQSPRGRYTRIYTHVSFACVRFSLPESQEPSLRVPDFFRVYGRLSLYTQPTGLPRKNVVDDDESLGVCIYICIEKKKVEKEPTRNIRTMQKVRFFCLQGKWGDGFVKFQRRERFCLIFGACVS